MEKMVQKLFEDLKSGRVCLGSPVPLQPWTPEKKRALMMALKEVAVIERVARGAGATYPAQSPGNNAL